MVLAAPALAAVTLCLRFSPDLLKAPVAALIIGAVLAATEQHADLSASALQGFQCIPDRDLPAAAIRDFAQGLPDKPTELSSAQLSCLARLLAAKNLTADFDRYPPDLLLFFDPAEVPGGTCGAFYARASRGNLDLLPRGSARRTGLLHGALTCLGVRSSRLRPEQLSSLGALVCDMEPETITASDPSILENLKLCPALTETQQDALNAVLLRGDTTYGDPSGWGLQTLQNLGPLVLALNQTTVSMVAEAAREAFGRSIAAAYRGQGRSQREQSLTLLRAFTAARTSAHPRLKRSADRCLSEPITASTISDDILPLTYDTSEQFELCLSNEVLKANLKPLLEQPLPVQYLLVMKKKLEQIYPSGIPEEQLKLLGLLSRQYTAEEISRWPVTSSDTLSALLDPSDGKWEPAQVQQLISRYLALGGTLTGLLLREIGGEELCNLQEEQINEIPPEAIRTAGQLNISSCSQTKKDQLYRKAQEAFSGLAGTSRAYYCRIWPYLGGAPAKDLKDLAKAGVDMDIETFLSLNPHELQKLNVMDVKNLLGENLPALKEAENETLVMCWVKRQPQRELDCLLGIGLQGGTEEPSPTGTATPPHPTTSASITPTATVPTATTLPPVPTATTLPPVPTPVAISSHPQSSTSPHKVPTATTLPTVPTVPVAISSHPQSSTSPHKVPTATTLPTVPTVPVAISSHPQSSTSPHKVPTPSVISPTPPDSTYTTVPSAAGSPTTTSTTQPAPTTGSIIPCSIHQSVTSNKTTPPAGTLLSTIKPNATSPSSIPPPALIHRATTTTTSVVTNPALTTNTPLVSLKPPAPESTTHPAPATHNTITLSTHNAPNTLVPSSTSVPTATTATEMNLPPHKPTTTTTTIAVTNPALTTNTPLVSLKPSAPESTTHPAPATHNTITLSTHNAPNTLVPNSTSIPAATTATEMNLPPHKPTTTTTIAVTNPALTTNLSTHNAPNTLVPKSTSVPAATTATEMNLPPHKSTPIPNSTISTQKSFVSSTPKTTTLACQTDAPPALLGPSSTTTSSETTKKTPDGVPEPPRGTPPGYINLHPEAGAGSSLSCCLLPVLMAAVGSSLLRGLL